MKRILKSIVTVMIFALMASLFAGCTAPPQEQGAVNATDDKKEFSIGCMPLNEPVVQLISDLIEAKGYDMKVIVFDGNNLPALALKDGSIDGLILNHLPWINIFNEQNNSNLVMVDHMYASLFALYSSKHASIDEIPNGATITISDDPANMQRSLELLEKIGMIKLGEKKGEFHTILNIAENNKDIKFLAVETTATAASYKDADATISFSSVMRNSGIDAFSYLVEDGKSVDFPTGLVVNSGNEEAPWAKALVEVTQTDEFKTKFSEIYQGAYVLFSEM